MTTAAPLFNPRDTAEGRAKKLNELTTYLDVATITSIDGGSPGSTYISGLNIDGGAP